MEKKSLDLRGFEIEGSMPSRTGSDFEGLDNVPSRYRGADRSTWSREQDVSGLQHGVLRNPRA